MNKPSWITVAPAQATGPVWHCTEVRHLTGAENQGRQNVFIWLYRNGSVVYDGLFIQYGWDGQHDDEKQPPKMLDKKPPDPSTDVAIQKGMHAWVEVVDPKGYPSDRVSNLHTEMQSDGPGNEWGHQSYYVRFELQMSIPPVPDNPNPGELEAMRADMQQIAQIAGKWGATNPRGWSWAG